MSSSSSPISSNWIHHHPQDQMCLFYWFLHVLEVLNMPSDFLLHLHYTVRLHQLCYLDSLIDNQYNVWGIYPNLFSQLSSDVAQPPYTIKTHCFQPSISQHFDHLGILLPIFFKHQLSFSGFIFIFTSALVFASFAFILQHDGKGSHNSRGERLLTDIACNSSPRGKDGQQEVSKSGRLEATVQRLELSGKLSVQKTHRQQKVFQSPGFC